MELLANFFGNNTSTKKNREKNRKIRVCRIEELESRDMLSAVGIVYDAPPPIEFGIVYHNAHWTNLNHDGNHDG